MSVLRSVIKGTGSYLPVKAVTNQELESKVETTHEWIVQRTGIHQRHIANEQETTAFMAAEAASKAIAAAGLTPADIGGIIVATTTPDQTFPSVAVNVQTKLGIPVGVAFDVQAVCSGFIYALTVADNFVARGQIKHMLVIGAEKMSSILDWNDRTTCVLFGDGAGAVVISAEQGKGDLSDSGILATCLQADGQYRGALYTSGGTSTTQQAGTIVMNGREIFKAAVTLMSDVVTKIMQQTGLGYDQIDWLVPHQANIRIIEGTAEKLGLSMDRVVVTVDKHGNTSAASVPLALDAAYTQGKIKPGQLMLLEALGGGLTWGAALIRA